MLFCKNILYKRVKNEEINIVIVVKLTIAHCYRSISHSHRDEDIRLERFYNVPVGLQFECEPIRLFHVYFFFFSSEREEKAKECSEFASHDLLSCTCRDFFLRSSHDMLYTLYVIDR